MKVRIIPSSLIYPQHPKHKKPNKYARILQSESEEQKFNDFIPSRSLIRPSTIISKPYVYKKLIDLENLSVINAVDTDSKLILSRKSTNQLLLNSELKIKEFCLEYQDFITLREINSYEKNELYTDNYPLLELRKALNRIKIALSELCKILSENSIFQYFVLFVILINIATLALQGNTPQDTPIFQSFELFYIIVYTVEACLKIIANGLIFIETHKIL